MKSLILKAILVLFPVLGFAQIGVPQTVFDPTAAGNMTEQIATSGKQLTQLEKSLEYLKKADDKLNQVSGYVRNMQDLNQIKKMYAESISMATKIRGSLPNVKNAGQKQRIISQVTACVTNLNNSISFITKVLSSNFFSMSDSERMELIKAERSKILINRSKLAAYF